MRREDPCDITAATGNSWLLELQLLTRYYIRASHSSNLYSLYENGQTAIFRPHSRRSRGPGVRPDQLVLCHPTSPQSTQLWRTGMSSLRPDLRRCLLRDISHSSCRWNLTQEISANSHLFSQLVPHRWRNLHSHLQRSLVVRGAKGRESDVCPPITSAISLYPRQTAPPSAPASSMPHDASMVLIFEPNSVWRSSLILSAAACYIMWAVTFFAQWHPLISPRRSDLREEYW